MIKSTHVDYKFEINDIFVVVKEKEGYIYKKGEFLQITAIQGDFIRLHTSAVVSGRLHGASCGTEWLAQQVDEGYFEYLGTLK